VNKQEEMKFLCAAMMRLRHTATLFFGLLLAGFLAFEAVEAAGALQGETFNLAFDFDSEESEEGQEEEREGPEENKDKTSENVAFLNGERLRLAAERQRMQELPPPNVWDSMVAAKIWEPPEWV